MFARVIDDHLDDAFDVMADMVFRPLLADLDSEREVILEEIAMYEDDPQEKVFDLLGEATFGHDPLGRAIIGTAEVVSGTPASEIARFHAERYTPGNVVIAAAGVGRSRCVRRAGRRPDAGRQRRPRPTRAGRRRPRPARRGGALSARTPSSSTSAWAAPGPRATTTAASRCASWTRSSGARPPRACSRRSASSADSPTPCTRSSAPTTTSGRSASTSGTRADNLGRRDGGRRRPSSNAVAASRPPARSCSGPRRTSRAAWCSRWNRPGPG